VVGLDGKYVLCSSVLHNPENGIKSPTIFREYVSDLSKKVSKEGQVIILEVTTDALFSHPTK
jgi:hypothetical protein